MSTGDTSLSPDTEDAARLAAGGALVAVEAVMGGRLDNAFVAVRPPGHHASRDQGMGFCLFNNVALAARHAQAALGCDRVLFFSVHQAPLYPGSGSADERGAGPGLGFTINCPLPAGSGGQEVLAALQERLVPAAEAFRPSLVLLSSGFDGMAGDPLAHLQLTATDVADLTLIVKTLAARTAEGRLVSLLEGGYGLGNLARGAAAHVEALLVG